jgi:hypothetical protein
VRFAAKSGNGIENFLGVSRALASPPVLTCRKMCPSVFLPMIGRRTAVSDQRRCGDGAERAAGGGDGLGGGLEKMKPRSFYFTRSQIKRVVVEDFGVSAL